MADNPLINPASIYGYNPWVQPPAAGVPVDHGFSAFTGGPQQPYYNPFNPNLGTGGAGSAAPITSSPITECQDGYVKDNETGTCVPIEEAMKAVERGDRDKNSSFGAVPNKGGDGTIFGYTSFADFFDGGGPGRSGPTFQGGLGILGTAASAVGNALEVRPYGYEKRYGVGGTHDYGGGSTAANVMSETNRLAYDDRLAAAEAGRDSDDNDRQSAHDRRHAANVAKRREYSKKHTDASTTTSRDLGKDVKERMAKYGRYDGGLISMNTGGDVPMGLIAYRQEGGPVPLPGAVPPNPQEPMAPPMDPGMAPPAGPPMAPAAPPMPPAPVRKSFAEKVAEAKAAIQGGGASVPVMPELAAPEPMGMDGQMDGPVMIHPDAGMTSPGMVGPDMGPDTVDAELEEGSMVMNPEASEMFSDELQGYYDGGYIHA